MDQAIVEVLGGLELGAAQEVPGFVVVPIMAPSQDGHEYVPLGKAMEAG